MKYPINFVYAVIDQFPEHTYLQKVFEKGSSIIGRFLDDQIVYLTALLDCDYIMLSDEEIRNTRIEIDKIKKLYENYWEIAARQRDYAVQTHFRSIPIR
jgi:hypothetical protein